MKLYKYQEEGVKFLVKAQRALLCDEMGLGKTAQAIVACKEMKAKKILVICPRIIRRFWVDQFKIWYPELCFAGPDTDGVWAIEHIHITHYEMIRPEKYVKIVKGEKVVKDIGYETELNDLLSTVWDVLIIDEAHRFKNRKALQTKSIRLLTKKSKCVFLLTGTPVLNRIDELWSLLNLLYPKFYSSFWRFVQTHAKAYPGHFGWIVEPEPTNLPLLQKELSGFFLRREKGEGVDLPPLTEQQLWLTLYPEQQKMYNQMKEEMTIKLQNGEELVAPIVLAQITRLKQVCVATQLVDFPVKSSVKFDAVFNILKDTDKKVLIFSNYANALMLLQEYLLKNKVMSAWLDARLSETKRQEVMDAFARNSKVQCMLTTIQLGGIGLTLTAASVVVFLDVHWTPAINRQAIARVYRNGQKNPVTVIKLLVSNSVEEWVEKLLNTKQDIVSQFARYLTSIG